MRKALTILQHQDDMKNENFLESDADEIISEQNERGGYTGLQFFKKGFINEDMIDTAVAPGRNFLKVTGVLYIISSGMGFIALLTTLFEAPDLSLLWSFLSVCYSLFMGVMGIKYCKSIDRANLLCILAIIHLLDYIFHFIHAVVLLPMQVYILAFVLFVYAFYFALPILYLVGAQKNRSAKHSGYK